MKRSTFVKLIFVLFILGFSLSFYSCGSSEEDETNSKDLESKLNSILGEIVTELKPGKVELTPKTYVELNAVLVVSNYFLRKELSKDTNLTVEEIEEAIFSNQAIILSNYGLSYQDFEEYPLKKGEELREFEINNPDIIRKYNEINELLPTLLD